MMPKQKAKQKTEQKKTQVIKWMMKGKYLKNCNCNAGCPCDFWAKPTHTKCEGMLGMEIDEGYFGDVSLKGAKFVAMYHWPGPLHEGNGVIQPFLDKKMNIAQQHAILQILSGKAGNPWFEVIASLTKTVHEPQVVPIHFDHDIKNLKARVVIPGILETTTEPIKNVATGDAYRVLVQIPGGMEYKVAETAVAVVNKGTGKIKYNWPNSHSSLAYVKQTESGLKK